MEKSLKNLSDKQLIDVLNATVLSYKVYLEENYATNDLVFAEEFLNDNHIKNSWKKHGIQHNILDQSDPNEMADAVYQFIQFYKNDNRDLYNKFVINKSDLYDALYKNDKYTSEFDSYGGYPKQSTYLLAKRDAQIEIVEKTTKAIKNLLDKNIISNRPNSENQKKFLTHLEEHFQYDLFANKITQINEQKFSIKEYKTVMATNALNENFTAVDKSYFLNENYGFFKSRAGKTFNYTFKQGLILIGEKNKDKDTAILANFSKDENGDNVLNITIRGTEGKAKNKSDYFLHDYMNMDRHYDNLEIPIEIIIQKAIKENNSGVPLKVNLYGHSLGAAMVEKFLSAHADFPEVKYNAVCIASPGGIHQFPHLITFLENTQLRPLIPVFNFFLAATNATQSGAKKITNKFFNLGASALEKTISIFYEKKNLKENENENDLHLIKTDLNDKNQQDSRILFVKNSTDLIPKIGSLLYKSSKNSVVLNEVYSESMLESHKMYNYYEQVFDEIKSRPHLKNKLENLFIVEEAIESRKYMNNQTNGKLISLTKELVKGNIEVLRKKAEKEISSVKFNDRKLNV